VTVHAEVMLKPLGVVVTCGVNRAVTPMPHRGQVVRQSSGPGMVKGVMM